MTCKEALEYLNRHGWSSKKIGLERTRELLAKLGNPQDGLKFVHVAGTNGKGSTCAMLESILRHAGYRTGLFPSPYIENFRERIQVNCELIPEEALARLTERVAAAADTMEDHPSHFELITALGLLYFTERHCDIIVLEVGMGGLYDSTNVISAPEAAVICNIGLDHTEYLGNTLEEIAFNKCGIIKSGSAVVSYENVPCVMEVIEQTCREKGCRLYRAAKETLSCPLSLYGAHQKRNARTVLAAVRALRDRGWEISEDAVRAGLADTVWPARFEILNRDPVFILDGGHNPQCAEALLEALSEFLPGQKVTFLIGMLADKDYRTVLDLILPYGETFITVTPESPRALTAEDLAAVIREKGKAACTAASAEAAIRAAVTTGLPVVAFGSLYLAGEVRPAYRRYLAGLTQERPQGS